MLATLVYVSQLPTSICPPILSKITHNKYFIAYAKEQMHKNYKNCNSTLTSTQLNPDIIIIQLETSHSKHNHSLSLIHKD